jgi:DNA replication and repair protein RecF
VVSGPNGAGKTSLVEAVTFATLGVSPRTSRDAEAVRRGAEAFHVALRVDGPAGTRWRQIGVQAGVGRRLRLDDAPVRSLGAWRAPGSVLIFLPEELRSVKGPPAARRRALDRLIEGADPGFGDAHAAFTAALTQRNALLRRIRSGEAGVDALAPWDHAVAMHGAQVAAARAGTLAALTAPFAGWLDGLGGGRGGRLVWEPSPSILAGTDPGDFADVLARRLDETRGRDIAAAQTLSGPQRDDVWIGAADNDLRRTGSQGEQRTAVLAFLLACRDHLSRHAARPILLLDDVLSELDPRRRRLLLDSLSGPGQAWVTSADPDAAALAEATGARHHVHVEDGRVH